MNTEQQEEVLSLAETIPCNLSPEHFEELAQQLKQTGWTYNPTNQTPQKETEEKPALATLRISYEYVGTGQAISYTHTQPEPELANAARCAVILTNTINAIAQQLGPGHVQAIENLHRLNQHLKDQA